MQSPSENDKNPATRRVFCTETRNRNLFNRNLNCNVFGTIDGGGKGETVNQNEDQNFDPMIYDVMRELTTQIVGTYSAWESEAATEREAKHWRAEWLRVRSEAREVNPRSRAAIESKTAELQEVLRGLPAHAPTLA